MPFAWVAADSVYGVGEIETALRRAGKGYVLGVTGTHLFGPGAASRRWPARRKRSPEALPASAWVRLSAGDGTKGPRLYDWAYLELADLEAAEEVGCPDPAPGRAACWSGAASPTASLAYFTTWCPAGTPIETLVGVEGRRWAIEDAFETAKTELGLDHNETRSWHGWHRHVSLVMLAFAMLAVIRHRANAPHRPQKARSGSRGCADLVRWSVQEIRRIAIRLAQRRIEPASSSPGRSGGEPIRPPHNAPPEAKTATVMLP